MGYIVGRVTAEIPEGRPSEIERLSFLDRNEFDFSTAIGFAERLLEERNTSEKTCSSVLHSALCYKR